MNNLNIYKSGSLHTFYSSLNLFFYTKSNSKPSPQQIPNMSSIIKFFQKDKANLKNRDLKQKRKYSIFETVYFDETTQSTKTKTSIKRKFIFFGLLFCCTCGIPTYHPSNDFEYYY